MITLTVNDTKHELEVDPDLPLLWALRDKLNLTGTKYGCGRAQCGACKVHINGEAVPSCVTRVGDVADASVTTIEGVSGRAADAVKAAWQKLDVVQCGYCQSGQIMAAISLLSTNKAPTDADINAAMDVNVCRCGTYVRIRQAVHEAAKSLG